MVANADDLAVQFPTLDQPGHLCRTRQDTLPRAARLSRLRTGDTIATRLKHIHSGDIIIARMNKPASDSAEGLSIGLQSLLDKGFRFVRLDQVKLQQVK